MESIKNQLQCQQNEIEALQCLMAVFSAWADAEKQETLRLDTYSRRENFRLIAIAEAIESVEVADLTTSQGQAK